MMRTLLVILFILTGPFLYSRENVDIYDSKVLDQALDAEDISANALDSYLCSFAIECLNKKNEGKVTDLVEQLISSINYKLLASYIDASFHENEEKRIELTNKLEKANQAETTKLRNTVFMLAIARLAHQETAIQFEKTHVFSGKAPRIANGLTEEMWNFALQIADDEIFNKLHSGYIERQYRHTLSAENIATVLDMIQSYDEREKFADSNLLILGLWAKTFRDFAKVDQSMNKKIQNEIKNGYPRYGANRSKYGKAFLRNTTLIFYRLASPQEIEKFRSAMLEMAREKNLPYISDMLKLSPDNFINLYSK